MNWTPLSTAADVEGLVVRGIAESEVLEFKVVYWRPRDGRAASTEAAKDVAAFLNARGGTIVIGIGQGDVDDGIARKLVPVAEPSKRRSELVQALQTRLIPSSAADYVTIREVPTSAGTALVVNVRAWPHGVVAVRWSEDGHALRFVARRGQQLADFAWEDVVMRNDAARRRTYLRLAELVAGSRRPRVAIGSLVMLGDRTWSRVFEVPSDRGVGVVCELTEDALVVKVTCTLAARVRCARELHAQHLGAHKSEMMAMVAALTDGDGVEAEAKAWTVRSGPNLAIPLDLIRTAWGVGAGRRRTIGLLLDATLAFDGEWYFTNASHAGPSMVTAPELTLAPRERSGQLKER